MSRTHPPLWLVLIVAVVLASCSALPRTLPTSRAEPDDPSAPASSIASPGVPSATPTPDPTLWVAAENARQGTTDWQLAAVADDATLSGFADRASVVAGEPVVLRVSSTAASWTATVYRLGFYAGAGARRVWASPPVPGVRQAAPVIEPGNMVTAAAWTPSLSLDTGGWLPGSYLVTLVTSTGQGRHIPLTVRSDSFRGRLVLLSATTTYQAYNTWGGHSLYLGPQGFDDRARRVSFDRPYDRDGARIPLGYEWPVIFLAERLGLDLWYATVVDLERGADAFAGARGLVSLGHDEYWSVPMRDSAEALRDRGVNLAFLGANAVYWRVRTAPSALGPARVVEGYKDAGADPVKGATSTTLWRRSPNARPESTLVGMLYECFPADGALVVRDPDFFLFAGTGATRGSSYPGLVGTEIDRAYPAPLAPETLRVVAHSPVACGTIGKTYSDMTYYTVPSGAGVVAVGTMNWRYGLETVPQPGTALTAASLAFATTVTENLFRAMAAGPMGLTRPATSNLAEIAPPVSTRTGTGGAVG